MRFLRQKFGSHLLLDTNKQNNRHATPPQTNIYFIMPRTKGIGSRHRSGTGKNHGRQQTSPNDNRCFNCKDSNSKIPVPPRLNNSVINPPHLS